MQRFKEAIAGAQIVTDTNDDTEITKPKKADTAESDDSLIPPINYTDPYIWHDTTYSMEPIVRIYDPEVQNHIDEKGKINGAQEYDATKVEGIMWPLIELNNRVLEKENIRYMSLDYEEFVPTLYLEVNDSGGYTKKEDIPGMNSEIKLVMVPSVDGVYKPIRLLFQVTEAYFEDDIIYVEATFKYTPLNKTYIKELIFPYCGSCPQPENIILNTWEYHHRIAQLVGLGFASTDQCKNIEDRVPRVMSSETYQEFIQRNIKFGGLDENSIFDSWIDLYGYIVLVNVPYVMNSTITYRHLAIYATTGVHSTSERIKSEEHPKYVHRMLTDHNIQGAPNNMNIEWYDPQATNQMVEWGNMRNTMIFTPRGIQEGVNTLEQEDVLAKQNSLDAEHLEDYMISQEQDVQIERYEIPTERQRNLRIAFFNKYKQRTFMVRLSQPNFGLERGTLVELRIFADQKEQKQNIQTGTDNVLGAQSTDVERQDFGDLTQREAMEDGTLQMMNYGLSGQYYISGMRFEYSYEDGSNKTDNMIKQTLFLIKKGLYNNAENKYTSPRIEPEEFRKELKSAQTNTAETIQASVQKEPVR